MIVHIHHLYYFLSYFLFKFTSFFFENVPTTLRPLPHGSVSIRVRNIIQDIVWLCQIIKKIKVIIYVIYSSNGFWKTTNKIYFLSYSLLSEENTTIGNYTVNFNCKKNEIGLPVLFSFINNELFYELYIRYFLSCGNSKWHVCVHIMKWWHIRWPHRTKPIKSFRLFIAYDLKQYKKSNWEGSGWTTNLRKSFILYIVRKSINEII